MLQQIVQSVGLDIGTCAGVLGISPKLMQEWAVGQQPIPSSYANELSVILGVDRSLLDSSKQIKSHISASITPATWYKFRGAGLHSADRELVLLVRRLGNFMNELEAVTGNRAVGWEQLFDALRAKVDLQAPPREQGRQAARLLRESRGLNKGANGIGEIFRGNLRTAGLLVFETPLRESILEGCAFYVGRHASDRPCVFANTHHSTWFRRNVVLMHEIAHAIFDAASAGASVDLEGAPELCDLAEERADAFAQEALIPKEVLRHVSQARGIRWDAMSHHQLAILVAETHAEKKKVLEAALEFGFITAEQFERYSLLEINPELKAISERALSTKEYIDRIGGKAAAQIGIGKRTTTASSRPIRLPVPYITSVLRAFSDKQISRGKAAEMLMVDEDTFAQRFENSIESTQGRWE